jgi:hypothetical protein
MSFLDDIPDYKNYFDNIFLMQKIPKLWEIWEALEAYAVRAEDKQAMVNRLNNIALLRPTSNWGDRFLVADLENTFRVIKKKATDEQNLPLFFDAITEIIDEVKINTEEINDFLRKYDIEYKIFKDDKKIYHWSRIESSDKLTKNIDDTLTTIKTSGFDQALEHFKQAKMQMENAKDERSRKNAVRDCTSAMESIISILGNANDIKEATKVLRESNSWGPAVIVKDGISIYNKLHELYPDFRHGSREQSSMTINEASYWVGRINVFIQYLVTQKNNLILN